MFGNEDRSIVKTYDYINRVVLTLPRSVYVGTWTHSPLSLLCITMILCVRRKILKLLRSSTIRLHVFLLFMILLPNLLPILVPLLHGAAYWIHCCGQPTLTNKISSMLWMSDLLHLSSLPSSWSNWDFMFSNFKWRAIWITQFVVHLGQTLIVFDHVRQEYLLTDHGLQAFTLSEMH